MLVQFKVSNYRSIGDEQVLSLVPAGNQKEFADNIIGENSNKVLNLVAVYGANGSGKSNLLTALGLYLHMIKTSSKVSSTDRLRYDPFLLREGWEEKPTVFEMVFTSNEYRYRFGFSYNATSILSEWLFRKKTGREVNVFQREGEIIEVSSGLKGNAKIIDAAVEATGVNSLFLAMLDTLSIDEANEIYSSLKGSGIIDGHYNYNFSQINRLWESDNRASDINLHLKRLELGMLDIKAEKINDKYSILSVHRYYDRDGNPTKDTRSWDYMERESSGSIKALELWWPLKMVLQLGALLIIDELEAKMHPLLTLDTINLFLNKETNPNNAQLIFSTHDTNLLTYADLRRDQIYFAEKNAWESTEIYSLSDFVYLYEDGKKSKERVDTDKEKRYIEGRYGAVPVLGRLADLKKIGDGKEGKA